jgi:hypothetical protein
MGGGTTSNGALLHGFQQSRLGFRGGPVDFVGEDEVGKDGARLKAQLFGAAVAGVHNHAADDVGGHEVGGELDAGVLELKSARQGAQESRLAQAGNALKEHVSTGEEANQYAFNYIVLPYYDFGYFAANGLQPVDRKLECRFGSHANIVLQPEGQNREISKRKVTGIRLSFGLHAGLRAHAAGQYAQYGGHFI